MKNQELKGMHEYVLGILPVLQEMVKGRLIVRSKYEEVGGFKYTETTWYITIRKFRPFPSWLFWPFSKKCVSLIFDHTLGGFSKVIVHDSEYEIMREPLLNAAITLAKKYHFPTP